MIALPKQMTETAGECVSCGLDLSCKDSGYWHGARVCRECLTDLKYGESRVREAESLAEWQRSQSAGAVVVALVVVSFPFGLSLLLWGVRWIIHSL